MATTTTMATTMPATADELLAGMLQLRAQLDRVEEKLDGVLNSQARKDWYTTAEVAARKGVTEATIREACRLGRIRAEKRKSGQGPARPWMISHVELERYLNEGLLPLRLVRD
jgi:hypothetical protein